MHNLIIYGGTFDPIHKGHIQVAMAVQDQFHFERFLFLPCKIPLLKTQARATPKQRLDMLQLALANQNKRYRFEIDCSEIDRDTPSYMVDTLKNFRKELGKNHAITLLLGLDAFYQLPQWHKWHKLLTLANLLVIPRTGLDVVTAHASPASRGLSVGSSDVEWGEQLLGVQTCPEEINLLLNQHETHDELAINNSAHGLIYSFDAGHYPIFSSHIRQQLMQNKNVERDLSPAVLQYINKNRLYR